MAGNRRWTRQEDLVLINGFKVCSLIEMADRVGRTNSAVKVRLHGLRKSGEISGFVGEDKPCNLNVMSRGFVAKTCPTCSRLLTREYYSRRRDGRWGWCCCECLSEMRRLGRAEGKYKDDRDSRDRRDSRQYYEEITKPLAINTGLPLSGHDLDILADPYMTILEKAFEMKRTYNAVSSNMSRYGWKTSKIPADASKADGQFVVIHP